MDHRFAFRIAPFEPRDPVCACGHGASLHIHREGMCEGCMAYVDAESACLHFAELDRLTAPARPKMVAFH